jgi:hypothetical protein
VVLVTLLITLFAFSVYVVKKAWRKETAIVQASTPAMAPSAAPSDPAPQASTEPPDDPAAPETDNANEIPVETAAAKPVATQPAASKPAAAPANNVEPKSETVVVVPPPPDIEQQPLLQPAAPLPATEINQPARRTAPRQDSALYKQARLLISSAAAPEAFTIIVNVDNQFFFSRNGVEGREAIPLASAPSLPLSEERPLPPGKHKVQVNVMLGSQRVAKAREATERFDAGQRRILQIEFLPEVPASRGHDTNPFKISLK